MSLSASRSGELTAVRVDAGPPRVLVVDDEPTLRRSLSRLLTSRGCSVITADDGEQAMGLLEREHIDVALVDLMMPKVGGLELLEHVREKHDGVEVVMMTAFGDVETAVKAVRAGAYHFLTKPFRSNDEVVLTVTKAAERRRLVDRAAALEERLLQIEKFGELIGNSPTMQEVYRLAVGVAPTSSTVLILGESGTGKELTARAIHQHSPRVAQPFVAVNCSAIPVDLVESELFGHVRGAFTGATATRAGLFETADRGTLFLDEVGELSPSTQVRLLRVLQERCVRPVGSNVARPIDVRVIAATNRDLDLEVRERRFREDLFYRLNVVSIELPPLRNRGEDVVLLAHHLLGKHGSRLSKPGLRFSPQALEAIAAYPFPGNIRELENAIERAVIMTTDGIVALHALPPQLRPVPSRPRLRAVVDVPFTEARNRFERSYLDQVLEESSGNLSQAARRSGMDRSNFRRLLERHGVRNAS